MSMPRFVGRKRGPLTEADADECVEFMGSLYVEIEEFLRPFDFHLVGRVQNSGSGGQVGCVYVFFNGELFSAEQDGLMMRVQAHPEGGFEIVLGPWDGVLPLPAEVFSSLPIELCKHPNWRGLHVRNHSEWEHARSLIGEVRTTFSNLYGLE